jgi:hypothetical protein
MRNASDSRLPIPTRRMKKGANRTARVPFEHIIIMRKMVKV